MTTTPNYPVVAPEHIKQSRIIDLTLYKGNPRVHSDVQIERLVNSLKEFGFTNPVLVDDTGNVIAGHGRIAAAKKIELPAEMQEIKDQLVNFKLKSLNS